MPNKLMLKHFSDDGGETYELSGSTFPRADESSLAFVGEEQLVVNLRRDVKVVRMREKGL